MVASDGGEEAAGAALRRLRQARGLSLAGLSGLTHYSKGYLSKVETGEKSLTDGVARQCDEALGTGGELAALVARAARACPYRGLRGYEQEDARWFFGRRRAVGALAELLAQRACAGRPVTVVAVSGAGKSSLLRAGLLPAVRRGELPLPGSRSWPAVVLSPGPRPTERLLDRLGANELRQAPAQGLTGRRLLLIVDQLEEIFTLCGEEAERRDFLDSVQALAAQGAAVVLGVRADFYGRCLAYPELVEALRTGQYPLGPMSVAELREVITGPARAAGVEVEPGLVELLLRDLGRRGGEAYEPGALPLLSHALMATWQQRSDGPLTVAGYERTGGIHGAVAATAEHVYGRLTPAQQNIARQVLPRLIQVGDSGQDTRRPLPLGEVDENAETVLEAFTRARLLTADTEHVEISHEALLGAWPRLRTWIDTGRADLRARQRLSDAAGVWNAEGRDPSLLLRGSRLTAVGEWAAELAPVERAFLDASRERDNAERAAVRRRHRNTRRLAACLGILLVVAVVSAATAVRKAGEAERELRHSLAAQLSSEAARLAGSRPEVSALLAAAAYRQAPTTRTLSALMNVQAQGFARRLTGHEGPLRSASFSADGRVLATTDFSGEALVWEHARPRLLADLPHPLVSIAVSPDGRLAAAAGVQHDLWLWEVGTGKLLAERSLRGVPAMGAMAFRPDAAVLAVGSAYGVESWQVAGMRPLPPPETRGAVEGVAFSPDGALLAAAHRDGTVRLWKGGRDLRVLRPPNAPHALHDVAFSPDGTLLAAAGDYGAVLVWRTSDGKPSGELRGHEGTIWDVAFRGDGHMLATAGEDQQVLLWDVRSRRQLATLNGHGGAVHAVDFPRQGTVLASGSSDTTAALWDTGGWQTDACAGADTEATSYGAAGLTMAYDAGDAVVRYRLAGRCRELPVGTEPVHGLARGGPDDHLLAVGGAAGHVRLLDTRERPERHYTFDVPVTAGQPFAVAVSRDGTLLATGGNTNQVQVWDLTGHAARSRAKDGWGAPGTVRALAFDPGGRTLAVGADRGVAFRRLGHPEINEPSIPTTSRVTALAYSADRQRLAIGTEDGTVILWDPRHHREILTLTTRQGIVRGLHFAPDRRSIAITGLLRATREWTLDEEVTLGHACDIADVPSTQEWRRLLPAMDRAAVAPALCRRQ